MTYNPGYHNRESILAGNICTSLSSLGPSTYDEIAPMIEYWIEYVITEQFTTTKNLVDGVSPVAWSTSGSHPDISRFLKEFRDAPHRSEGSKSFIDELCHHILRWFAVSSMGVALSRRPQREVSIEIDGERGFLRAASFVGHLIGRGLLSGELARRHLVKPLTTHYYGENSGNMPSKTKVNAICQVFIAAGDTLLQGLLEPEDVQACFKKLDAYASTGYEYQIVGLNATRLNKFREVHATWLQQKE